MCSLRDDVRDRSWVFSSTEKESSLRPLCQRVEAQFQLPDAPFCRYFADFDDGALIWMHGAHFRGFHAPYSVRPILPPYLAQCFFHPFDPSREVKFEDTIAFDNLIYIRHTTCADTTSLVATYAHELQHVMQQTNAPRLLFVNQILNQRLKSFEPATIATDIPHERQANIVSKRVAEIVCGLEAVREFADKQIGYFQQVGEHEQKARWLFFRDVPSSTPYDLLQETLPLIQKYRKVIDFEMDVDEPQWWIGPLKDREATDKRR